MEYFKVPLSKIEKNAHKSTSKPSKIDHLDLEADLKLRMERALAQKVLDRSNVTLCSSRTSLAGSEQSFSVDSFQRESSCDNKENLTPARASTRFDDPKFDQSYRSTYSVDSFKMDEASGHSTPRSLGNKFSSVQGQDVVESVNNEDFDSDEFIGADEFANILEADELSCLNKYADIPVTQLNRNNSDESDFSGVLEGEVTIGSSILGPNVEKRHITADQFFKLKSNMPNFGSEMQSPEPVNLVDLSQTQVSTTKDESAVETTDSIISVSMINNLVDNEGNGMSPNTLVNNIVNFRSRKFKSDKNYSINKKVKMVEKPDHEASCWIETESILQGDVSDLIKLDESCKPIVDQEEDWISIGLNIDGNMVTSCVGVRSELLIAISNKTDRWLRCKLELPQKLDNVYINMVSRSAVIDPHGSKCAKIEVAPQRIGDIVITINVFVEDIMTKANKFTNLSLNLCGLEPKIEITSESSPESPSVLNFGYLPECCHHTHTLAVKNLNNFDIPLLFTIKKQSNNLQMFSLVETSNDSVNCSKFEKNTSASCILHTGQTLAIAVIFSSPKINLLKSQTGKAEVSALLDIELAEPLSNIILKEITLMGKVGYTHLLLNKKYIPLVFNFELGNSIKNTFPIKNGGCVPLNLAIKVDGTSIVDCLAIKPNRLHIPPGRESFIELHFQPKTEHPCEGTLVIEVEPNGQLFHVNVIGIQSAQSNNGNSSISHKSNRKQLEASTPKNAAPERSTLKISNSKSNQKSLTKNSVGNSDYSLKNLDSTSKTRCGSEVDSIARYLSGYEGSTSLKTQSDGVSEPIETPCKVNSKFPVATTHKQLVWGSVCVGKQKIESCMLRNESNSTVKLKACLDDIFNSFKLINDQGQSFNEIEIILHSMERVKFNVAFNPPKPGSAIARVIIKKLSSSRGSSNFVLPLHGYGGHVKVAVKGVSKDATGRMWLSMGQLDSANADMYSEFILSNSGTLDAFAMIKVIPKGLEVTASDFSINSPLLVIGAGASVSVTVAFSLQREVYKNLTLNRKDVNEIGVLEIITGDEPSRQRIRSMWNTNKNSDLEDKLTNWSLPQLCNIFPGEITLSELEFLNDPDCNIVRMLYRSFICQEISLTVEKNVDKSYFAKSMLVECGAEGNSQLFTSLYSETVHNAASTPFATPNVKSRNNLWDISPSLVVLMPPHIVNAGLIITNKFQTSQTFEAQVSNSYLQVEPSYGTIHPNDEVMITVSCSLSFKTREKVLQSVLRIYLENDVKEVKVHIKYANN